MSNDINPKGEAAKEKWTPANISEVCGFMGVSSMSEIMQKICDTHNASLPLVESLQEEKGKGKGNLDESQSTESHPGARDMGQPEHEQL